MQGPRYVESNLFLMLKREERFQRHKLSINQQKPEPQLSRKTTLPSIAHMNYLNLLKKQTKKARQISKYQQIQTENRKIITRIAQISHREDQNKIKRKIKSRAQSSSSLNQSFMKNRMKEITDQNLNNSRRLENVRSNLQLRKHEETIYSKQAEYKRNISHYSSKSQKRFKSFLSKLNISSRSYSQEAPHKNIDPLQGSATTNSKETSQQTFQFTSKKQSKFDNTNSISLLAANLARLRIGGNKISGSIKKLKLPPI